MTDFVAQADASYSGADLLDCSRYGELEDVKALLDSGINPDYQDPHGNTALHLSCANGHANVVRVLLEKGAKPLPNSTGNRPIHWAIQNRHEECAKVLLQMRPNPTQLNVLDKNNFGKSALSDAFNTGDAELVKLILNHKSAEEDMLLSQTGLGKGTNRNGGEGKEVEASGR
ncbi:unnamed protein product, partial [Discosporangium mesarthrocarpum]